MTTPAAVALDDVVRYLDDLLRTADVPDAEPALNGLQLANSGRVRRVAAAVDFSAQTVSAAVEAGADLLVVHHGMFWRGAQPLIGSGYHRLKMAIEADLAVYSSHIPLDIHPELGNNALLARALQLQADGRFGRYKGVEIGVSGPSDLSTGELAERVQRFASAYRTTVVHTPIPDGRRTQRLAIITGAGAGSDTLDEARERGVDTLIVGEGPHHSAVQAMEQGTAVIYGGHYATETPGVRALAERIARQFGVSHTFVDVPTGL
jgi:dinuclear metal center YbgI/SA1388 family protein